jgi:hypothetical protein
MLDMKNVQTKFTDEEYARVRALAEEQGKTLGEYLHDTALWVDEQRREEIRSSLRQWREENPELVTGFAELRDEYRQRFRGEAA